MGTRIALPSEMRRYNVQNVQRPAALLHRNILERFDALESFADFGCRGNPAFGDDKDVARTGFYLNTSRGLVLF